VPGHANLAWVTSRLGDPKMAIAGYRQALAIDPNHPQAGQGLAA
jgi:Tfp pilus assembly protein PilF